MKAAKELIIDRLTWESLMQELKRRGTGERESGAFLLAKKNDNKISSFVCYDDLDPHCLDHGIITFDGAGYIPLWQLCKTKELTVLADVHTHPFGWVGQSKSDSMHPMIAQKGHVAIILPYYGQPENQDLSNAGIYEYKGDKKWKTIKSNGYVRISE